MATQGIPVVSMGGFGQNGKDQDIRIADDLGRAFREIGFASVTEHGVADELVERAFRVAKQVFLTDMTEAERLAYEFKEVGRQYGYTPPKTEISVGKKKPNNMRFWHVNDPRANVGNVFPTEVPEFGPTMLELHLALKEAGKQVLRAIAMHLRRDPEFFVEWVEDGRNLLRPIHYPAMQGDEKVERSGAHFDINLITLLVPSIGPGLQVKSRQNRWVDATNPPGALVVNIGDMLANHTHGVLPSTKHQVVNPKTACGDRFSIPLFVHPKKVSLENSEAYLFHRLRQIGLLKDPNRHPFEVDY